MAGESLKSNILKNKSSTQHHTQPIHSSVISYFQSKHLIECSFLINMR